MVTLITACCLAIEIHGARSSGSPTCSGFLLAPAAGLIAGAIPALLVVRRSQRAEKTAQEKDDLIGLLLKDYAGERGDWVWSCDVDGRLRGVSQKFALHAGRPSGSARGDAAGRPARRGAGSKTPLPTRSPCSMRQRKPFYNVEARIVAGDGECRWRMAGKPVFRDARFDGYVGTAANITTEFRAKETMTYLAYQ